MVRCASCEYVVVVGAALRLLANGRNETERVFAGTFAGIFTPMYGAGRCYTPQQHRSNGLVLSYQYQMQGQ